MTRLAEKAFDAEGVQDMKKSLSGRLDALDRDLAEIKANVSKGKSAADNSARLNRLEIDLNQAADGYSAIPRKEGAPVPYAVGIKPDSRTEGAHVAFSKDADGSVILTASRSWVPHVVSDASNGALESEVSDDRARETYSIRLTKLGAQKPQNEAPDVVKVGEHYFRIEVDPVASRVDAQFDAVVSDQ